MKKIFILLFIIFLLFYGAKAETSIDNLEKEVKSVLAKVTPSIVKVVSQNHRNYFATGIVLDKDHVITNTIITRYPFNSIYVKSAKGDKYPAEIIGKDGESAILILKIGKNELRPIKQAKKFAVGDWIALVGVFYNEFPSINQGILSSATDDEMILNAPVVPGISGGAVVNKDGELIGIIRGRFGFTMEPDYTFKDHQAEILVSSPRSRSKDLCYAVPIRKVNRIALDLTKYGRIRRGWLGVTIVTSGKDVIVEQVVGGSPAEKGGIRKGDIILSIDEKIIKTPADVVEVVRLLKPDHKAKIKILRDINEKTILTTIGEGTEKDFSFSFFGTPGFGPNPFSIKPGPEVTIPERWAAIPKLENFVFQMSGSRSLGIETLTLTPELAREFSVKEGYGLLVSKLYDENAAERAGLQVADVIAAIDNRIIKSVTDLRTALIKPGKEDNAIQLKIYRKGKALEIKAVPNRVGEEEYLYEPYQVKEKEIQAKIAEEELIRKQREIIEFRGGHLYINGKMFDLEGVKEYKIELEKLRKERDKYKKEIEALKEALEREQKKEKKATK